MLRKQRSEALKAVARLREALQTLPFFGGKTVWFSRLRNFLGEERTASSTQAVTGSPGGELAQELKEFVWGSVRLLISAGKVDKRKVFYKAVDKHGTGERFAGLSVDSKDWAQQAEVVGAASLARKREKELSDEALTGNLVGNVGLNARLLNNEVEKLALFAAAAGKLMLAKHHRPFARGDMIGARICILGRCAG